MTGRWWRALLAVVVVAMAVVGVAGPVAAQDDAETGAPTTPDGAAAIDDLVGCVQSSQQLLVLLLIDESASLKASDPDDQRVAAAQSALDSLIALATTEGEASPTVDVAIAAFSNEYRPVQPWTPANADTAAELDGAIAGFADYESGIDTDFVNALDAGRDALAERSAEVTASGGAAPCRAVLLFTDGGFDLAVRESAEDQDRLGTTKPYAPGIELTTAEGVREAERAGREALCKPSGLADQLRADEVTILTVALSGDVSRRAQLPLAAATTGTADDYTCGTVGERATGAYLPAEGVDVLVARFNEVGTRLAGGNPYPGSDQVEMCGPDPCDEGSRSFELDEGLRRAQVLALPPAAGATVRFESPSGEVLEVTEPGSTTIGTTPVTVRALADRGLSIDLDRPEDGAGWTGQWRVSLLDPSGEQEGEPATLQIFVFTDLAIGLGEVEPLVRGADSAVTASLTAPEDVDVAALVTASKVELRTFDSITGATTSTPLTGPPAGPYEGTLAIPADLTSNALEVTVVAELTTSSSATLTSRSAPRELLVARPGGSIQILPPSLKLPSLTGEGSTSTAVILQGGEQPGCVWFEEPTVVSAPDGAAPLTFTIDGEPLPGEAACIAVPPKVATTVTLEVSPEGRASGAVRGTLRIFEKVEGAADATATDVEFRFDLALGVDETRRLLLAIALLIAGLVLPMALLLVINALTARFQTLDVVRGAALPVQLSPGTISRTDGAYPRALVLRDGDFESLEGLGTTRRFTFGGVVFSAKASRNPFGATIALAAPEGGAEKLKGNAGSRVELDPGLAGSWVFLLDAAKTRRAPRSDAHGLLIAFIAEGDATTQIQKLSEDISGRLPGVASSLASLVRATAAKPAKPAKETKAAKGRRGGEETAAPVEDDDLGGDPVVESVGEPEDRDAAPEAPAAAATPVAPLPDEAELTPDDFPGAPDDDPDAGSGGGGAPLGFGGNAAAPPPIRRDVEAGADGDADGGPAPTGFTGGPRA